MIDHEHGAALALTLPAGQVPYAWSYTEQIHVVGGNQLILRVRLVAAEVSTNGDACRGISPRTDADSL